MEKYETDMKARMGERFRFREDRLWQKERQPCTGIRGQA